MTDIGASEPQDWVVNAAAVGRWSALRLDQFWAKRELIYFFALRDLKVRYKQAFLGVAWAGIQPLVGALTFTILFHRLGNVDVGVGESYFAFALLGFGIWTYYSTSIQTGTGSLVANADLLTKVAFPKIVAPSAALLPGFIDLSVAAILATVVAVASATSSAPSTPGAPSAAPRRRLHPPRRPARRAPRLPGRLGRWPAAVGLVAFVWLEIVYGRSGSVAVGLRPHAVAVAALVYSVYTLAMMALFGVEKWCERRGLLGLLRHVPRLGVFGSGRPARPPPPLLGRDQLGDRAGLGRRRDRLDRHDQLRRGPGGRLQGRDRTPSMVRPIVGSD